MAAQQEQLLANSADYKAAYDSQQQWGTGGDYSRALQAVTTALVGSVSGQAASQVAGNALAPYAAHLIGQTFDGNHGSDPNAAMQVLSHALLGAVLAEVNGTSGTGGALAGAGGELAAQWLTKELYGNDPRAIDPESGKFNPNLLPEEDKQTIVALSQAVGALVGGMTGGSLSEAAIGSNIAGNAATNNYLTQPQRDEKSQELGKCANEECRNKVEQKWDDVSLAQSREMRDKYFDALTPGQQSQLLNLKPGTKEYDAILAAGVMQAASKSLAGIGSLYNRDYQLLTEADWQGQQANGLAAMSPGDRNRVEIALLGPVFGLPGVVTKLSGGSDQQVAAANQAGAIAWDLAGAAEVLGPATTRAGKGSAVYDSLNKVGAKKEISIPKDDVATLDVINVVADKPKANSVDVTETFRYSATFLAPEGYSIPALKRVGSLKGDPELPPKNANQDMVRSISRQNESATTIAQLGYIVEFLPNTGKKGANPDLLINGEYADVASPSTRSVNSVLLTVRDKVERQADNVVINLNDSPLGVDQVEAALQKNPINGLKRIFIIKGKGMVVIEAKK